MPSKSNNPAQGTAASPAHHAGPAKTLRLGRVKAVIWENEADQRTLYNVTFARTYMDEDKKFHDADSFGRDDLLLLAKLADQAHTYICDRLAGQKSDDRV
jgi:hypothetical protein